MPVAALHPDEFRRGADYYRRFIDRSVSRASRPRRWTPGLFQLRCSTTYLRAMTNARASSSSRPPRRCRACRPRQCIHAAMSTSSSRTAPHRWRRFGRAERRGRAAGAQLIAAEIEDGACLQIGIGACQTRLLAAAPCQCARSGYPHRDARGWHCRPDRGRIVTNARKQMDVGRSVFSFALGSGRLYRMIDGNQAMSAARSTIRTCRTTSRATIRSSRSTTPRRSTCRARRPRILRQSSRQRHRRPVAVRARGIRSEAASRFFACPRPSARALRAKVASLPR